MRNLLHLAAVVHKDLVSELRSKEVIFSMLLFAALLVLVFSFSFTRGGAASPEAAAGVVWVTLAFAGTLGVSRAFDRERAAGGLVAMLLSPVSRTVIYLAKVTGIFLFLSLTALLVVPIVAVFFGVPGAALCKETFLLLSLGILGISLLGAFFGAIMARSRARDMLFFVAMYPLLFPLLIAGVLGLSEIFAGQPQPERLTLFVSILIAFDSLIAVVALFAFDRVILD